MFNLNKNSNLALLCTLQTQHEHMSDAGRTLIEVIFQCTTTTMIQSISWSFWSLKFLLILLSFFLFYHKFLLKASSWLVFYGPWFTHYLYYYYYYILFSLQSGLKTKKFMLASTFIKNCSLVLLRNKRDIRSSNSIYNLRYFPRFFGPMCPYYYSTLFVRLQSG